MMMWKGALALAISVGLAGCASSWINDPSPTVKALVRDLTLQGYDCNPDGGWIICKETSVTKLRQPMPCDSQGCYCQPANYQMGVYRIGQSATGHPIIRHGVEPTSPPEKPKDAAPDQGCD